MNRSFLMLAFMLGALLAAMFSAVLVNVDLLTFNNDGAFGVWVSDYNRQTVLTPFGRFLFAAVFLFFYSLSSWLDVRFFKRGLEWWRHVAIASSACGEVAVSIVLYSIYQYLKCNP
jgi:hypothetical protein